MQSYFSDLMPLDNVNQFAIDTFRRQLLQCLLEQGVKQDVLDNVPPATIRNALRNNRTPEDVAWAILQ